MAVPHNIYAQVVFDLPPKIEEYLNKLKKAGQIDLDPRNGTPYVTNVTKVAPNFQVFFIRNGQEHNFIINTRKRRDPIISWDASDGYERKDVDAERLVPEAPVEKGRRERDKRMPSYQGMVERILGETQWQVTMSRMIGGKEDSITKVIDASTQQQAIQSAQTTVPNATAYTSITATQVGADAMDQLKDPMNRIDASQSGQSTPVLNPPTPQMEEALYPYRMNLTLDYYTLLGESRLPRLRLKKRHATLEAVVPDRDTMNALCRYLSLVKSPKAKTVLHGIHNSRR